MTRSSKRENRFLKIIKENNYCLSVNPQGIDINWPKSYALLYYSNKFENIYKKNRSPRILEINQVNKYKIKLWNCLFDKPVIYEQQIQGNYDYQRIKRLDNQIRFDIIFINSYKEITNIIYLINFLKRKLNKKGIIIIEDFYFSTPLLLRLFFSQEIKIYDFRINRFIINNCLIEIKNSSFLIKAFNKFKTVNSLLLFLLIDTISLIIVKIMNLRNSNKL